MLTVERHMRCPKEALRSSYIPDMTRVLGVYCFTNSSLFSCCLSRHPQAPAPYSPWSTNAQYSLTEWRCPKYLPITVRSIHVVVARLNSYDAEKLRLSSKCKHTCQSWHRSEQTCRLLYGNDILLLLTGREEGCTIEATY